MGNNLRVTGFEVAKADKLRYISLYDNETAEIIINVDKIIVRIDNGKHFYDYYFELSEKNLKKIKKKLGKPAS